MKFTNSQIVNFIILVLRWYLAFYMFDYGWSKMTGGQFSVHDSNILEKPIKEIDKFYIAWHLFSTSNTFNIIVGISQIVGSLLIVINRTALIGALVLLPILVQIFLIDLAFTTNVLGYSLVLRLLGMIACDLAILFYHKDLLLHALRVLTENLNMTYKYKWWLYLLLPLLGFMTDFGIAVLMMPIRWIILWLK